MNEKEGKALRNTGFFPYFFGIIIIGLLLSCQQDVVKHTMWWRDTLAVSALCSQLTLK